MRQSFFGLSEEGLDYWGDVFGGCSVCLTPMNGDSLPPKWPAGRQRGGLSQMGGTFYCNKMPICGESGVGGSQGHEE